MAHARRPHPARPGVPEVAAPRTPSGCSKPFRVMHDKFGLPPRPPDGQHLHPRGRGGTPRRPRQRRGREGGDSASASPRGRVRPTMIQLNQHGSHGTHGYEPRADPPAGAAHERTSTSAPTSGPSGRSRGEMVTGDLPFDDTVAVTNMVSLAVGAPRVDVARAPRRDREGAGLRPRRAVRERGGVPRGAPRGGAARRAAGTARPQQRPAARAPRPMPPPVPNRASSRRRSRPAGAARSTDAARATAASPRAAGRREAARRVPRRPPLPRAFARPTTRAGPDDRVGGAFAWRTSPRAPSSAQRRA